MRDVSMKGLRWLRMWTMVFLVSGLVFVLWTGASVYAESMNPYDQLLAERKVMKERTYTKPAQPTVYLTFDDGPSQLTPQILDILAKENIKGTFFALGNMAEAYPQHVQRIVREGHSLGNHTYNHEYKQLYSDFQSFWRQIQQTEEVFARVAGVRPNLVRAPGGTHRNFDAFYFYYLDQAEYRVHDWDIDSGDSKRRGVPAKEIIDNVKRGRLSHEVTVLLHDGKGHAETLKALPEIIRYFKSKGYVFDRITSEVKPTMFTIGKEKWNRRHHNMQAFNQLTTLVSTRSQQAQPNLWVKDQEMQLAHQSQLSIRESNYALAHRQASPLVLQSSGVKLQLEPAQYELKNDRLHVPLRQFIEHLGGRIDWDHQKKVATIHNGLQVVEYDFQNKTHKNYSLGQEAEVTRMAEMSVKDGVIMVPLRETAELMNRKIALYTIHSDYRVVQFAPPIESVDLAYSTPDAVQKIVALAGG